MWFFNFITDVKSLVWSYILAYLTIVIFIMISKSALYLAIFNTIIDFFKVIEHFCQLETKREQQKS